MSNNLEIVMDIDTLEIFEVIDLDSEEEVVAKDTKDFTEEVKESPYDDLNRVWLCSGYYYNPSQFAFGSRERWGHS